MSDESTGCAHRHGCSTEPVVRITYFPGRSDLFCQPHADAKCLEAESKGVFLMQEALPDYDPDTHGGWY